MKAGRRWMTAAQVAASAALLALAVALARPSKMQATLAGGNGWLFASSFLFIPVLIALRVARWHMLARTRRAQMKLAESFHSYMGGLTLATVTPLAAGELARGVYAAPDDKAGFVGLTLLDKAIDAATLVLFACAGLAIVAPGWAKAAGIVGAVLWAAAWLAARRVAAAVERRLPNSRIAGALARALAAAREVSPKVLALCLVAAAVNLALYYVQLYVIMYSLSPTMRPEAVGLFPVITLASKIPSVSGLGVREFTAGALFAEARYAVGSAAAVMASFAQFMMVNALPAAAWLVAAGGFRRLIFKHSGGVE